MSEATDPGAVFAALVRGIQERRWGDVAELYAEDAVVEHPLANPDSVVPRWLRGRKQLREHFESVSATNITLRAERVRLHRTDDAEVVVAEFQYAGHDGRTKTHFSLPCIFVLRVRDGLIVESRDYIGPRRAAGDVDAS